MDILGQLQALLTPQLWPLALIIFGILGLLIAWVVARIGAFLVRRAFERLKVDERASQSLDTKTQVTKWVSGLTFWVLFIVVIWQLTIGAQRFAGVPTGAVQTPLGALLSEWLGKLANVGVLLLVAWLVATILKFLVV